MATSLIMPALEMAQESGRLVRWLKHDGETVIKGEPIMEIETDKVTVEIEAPDSGILGGILAGEGDMVPVGQTVAWILAPGESPPPPSPGGLPSARATSPARGDGKIHPPEPSKSILIEASPLARKIANEHGIDLAFVKSDGKRIEKADVLAYIHEQQQSITKTVSSPAGASTGSQLVPASPKARRLAAERGIELATISGSGPNGAVLAADVPVAAEFAEPTGTVETPGTVWRVMAERVMNSWTTVPHFYLVREVDASSLIEWRKHASPVIEKRTGIKPTFTDFLVKLVGFTLRDHPRMNAAWANGDIRWNQGIHVGIATAIEDGLIVPVIRNADVASLGEITVQRRDLIERAHDHKLRPIDIAGCTFTLSNLGMYNIDAFGAIVNTPQAAILAMGRIADRIVAVNGQAAVRPMMVLTLSCDHRVVDGARAAKFLDDLANLAEDPWRLLS